MKTLNRRTFVAAGIAAAIAPFTDGDGWITICAKGMNLAGRLYDDAAISVVLRDVRPGMKIFDWVAGDHLMQDLRAIVSAVRVHRADSAGHSIEDGDMIQVKAKWFAKKLPSEPSWLTLNGMMSDRLGKFELLEVKHLDVTSGGSTFSEATSV
jgi:hypothetical protein